jgi:hypothetical protein
VIGKVHSGLDCSYIQVYILALNTKDLDACSGILAFATSPSQYPRAENRWCSLTLLCLLICCSTCCISSSVPPSFLRSSVYCQMSYTGTETMLYMRQTKSPGRDLCVILRLACCRLGRYATTGAKVSRCDMSRLQGSMAKHFSLLKLRKIRSAHCKFLDYYMIRKTSRRYHFARAAILLDQR